MLEGRRRFHAMIVTALLLTGGVLVTLLWHISSYEWEADGGDGEEDPGWRMEGGQLLIHGDVVWEDVNETLPPSVVVQSGGRLTVRDSLVRADVVDLAVAKDPLIDVEEGGSLVLERSELVVEDDPMLDRAYACFGWYDADAPALWRAVNLRDAQDPALEFEMEWVSGTSVVVVAVQETPESDLEALEVLRPEDHVAREWLHVRVPLDGYVGGVPRVVLYVDNATNWDVLVADLRVTDGGGNLTNGLPFTGDLEGDGWYVSAFDRFFEQMGNDAGLPRTLVSCEGRLEVRASTVASAPGLPRVMEGYVPQLSMVEGEAGPATLIGVTRGGDVRVTEGILEVHESTFEYVPVIGEMCDLDLRRSAFFGDHDLVTVSRPRGEVLDCSFVFLDPDMDRGWHSGVPWALSAEGAWGADPLAVSACDFSGDGSGIGLNLNGAWVDVRDCSFADLRVAVWDHESGLTPDWDGLNATSTFDPSCDAWYLGTEGFRVSYRGAGMPWPGGRHDYYWTTESYGLDDLLPLSLDAYYGSTMAALCVPVLVTGPSAGEVAVEELTDEFHTYWGGRRTVTFDPREAGLIVDFDLWTEQDILDNFRNVLSVDVYSTANPGVIGLQLEVDIDDDDIDFPAIHISVDGDHLDDIDVGTHAPDWRSGRAIIDYGLQLKPGFEHFCVTLDGVHRPLGKQLKMARWEAGVFLASGAADPQALVQALGWEENVVLVVPSNVTLEGLSYVSEDEEGMHHKELSLTVLTGEGSRVGFDRFNLSDDVLFCDLFTSGPGEVWMRNWSGVYLDHHDRGGRVRQTNVSFLNYYLAGYYTDVEVYGPYDRLTSAYLLELGSNLTMRGVESVDFGYLSIEAAYGNVTLENCSFAATGQGHLQVGGDGRFDLDVRDCRFERVRVLVAPGLSTTWTVNVTSCRFEGNGSYLTIIGPYRSTGQWGNRRFHQLPTPSAGDISGNVFAGEGAGMLLDPVLRAMELGVNELRDGARAYFFLAPDPHLEWDEGVYGDCVFLVLPGEGYLSQAPYDSWEFRGEWLVLVEVTDDPLAPLGPVQAVGAIRAYSQREGQYHGFIVDLPDVRADLPSGRVRVPSWPSVFGEIEELRDRTQDFENWWTR